MKSLLLSIFAIMVFSILFGSSVFAVPIEGNAEKDDFFGSSVATGDFDGDGADDLAIGVPNKSFANSTGAVNVIYGSQTPTGLTATGNQLWYQGKEGP
jgi:FG-GAP repeat